MQNLFFRNRFVLGVLMVCVLMLGVQGSAEALTLSPSTSPSNYSTLTAESGSTITVNMGRTRNSLNNASAAETVTITAVNSVGANDPPVIGDEYPSGGWGEVVTTSVTDLTDGTGNGTITIPSSVKITVQGAGTITVTVTWIPKTGSDSVSKEFTFYVVTPPHLVSDPTTTLVDAGVHYGYKGVQQQINGAFGFTPTDAPVFYSVTGSGSLYVGEGEPKRRLPNGEMTSTSSNAEVYLRGHTATSRITAYVAGVSPKTAIYIYNDPSNPAKYPRLEKTKGDDQTGAASGRLEEYLEVKVIDSANRGVPGVAVAFTSDETDSSFIQVPGTMLTTELESPATTISVITDSSGLARTYFVTGDSNDTVTATLTGPDLTQTFTVTVAAATTPASIAIVSGDGQRADADGLIEDPLVVVVKDARRRRLMHSTGNPVIVQFLASDGGELTPPTSEEPGDVDGTPSPTVVNVQTNSVGEASIRYTPPAAGGRRTVRASINNGAKSVTFTINGVPSSGGGGTGDTGDAPPTITRTLDIDVSSTGSTREVTVTALQNAVSQTGISVALTVTGSGASLSETSGASPLESTLTLPSTAGTYTLRASTTATGYSAVTEDVTVTLPGTLGIALVGNQVNGAQTIQVTARNAAGSLETTAVTVTLSGAGISRTVPVTGSQNIPITLPTTSGTLTASATGYRSGSVTLPARSTTTTTTTTTDTTTTDTTTTVETPEPSRINIVGSATRSDNTANQQLDAPLLVQVVDGDGDGVEDIRVIFRVREGQGRLSERGNGRATTAQTDSRGHARVDYTPISASSTVEAEVRGVTRTVTFTITTGAAPAATGTAGATRTYKVGDPIPLSTGNTLSFSGSRRVNGTTYTCVGPGECVVSYGLVTRGEIRSATTPTVQAKAYKVGEKIPISLNDTLTFTSRHTVRGTTYTCVGPGACVVSHGLVAKGEIRVVAPTSATTPPRTTEINPVVQVGAAQRPPMLWVDGGAIYALVGASPERFAPGVDNAQNLTVAGGKVYWTEKTGESGGTINSANLNGSNVQELAAILAVPMGIAVDTAGSKLYWTNARGRIQSANLDGSRITNELQNLEGVMDIALAGGNAYWTQGGNVRFVNLRGQKQIRNISTGTDTAGSLAIGGGKVYWTEMTGDSGGTVNSANLNGSGARQLASILATPTGIAVDGSRSKLYWGNARGRIQAANLDGSKIQNVVDGLGSPGDMVISNSLKAPAGTTTAPKTTAANKYDVNGDGSVDSMDVDALVVAVSAGITDAKYDVNADGKVDINDVVAVSANRSAGAAGAPTLIGNIKLSAIQIDRLQEQIELLIATGDRSPAAMKTLIYLQQLIALARPEQTQLFANYPNPFNPETWMPYELAMDTNVKITIYASNGVVVRTLPLGQQSAGYYTDRERAAYWDGRNALGEQVASGVYFYQLETDAMSMMRKMVILK